METGPGPSRLLLLLIFSVLTSCQSDVIFSEHERMSSEGWNRHNTALFTPVIADTLSASSIDVTLRTGSSYPFRNIYLFITTAAPNGTRLVDTLEYILADEKGNRLGKGTGDIRELKLNLRENVYFPQSGTYVFRIEHAMREETLEGIYDVGLTITRISPKKR
jgi:gliding motility-associated lipoprotein GldH